MTYLEMVQRLARQCGDRRPISTLEQPRGIVVDYIDWINDAWRNIQNVGTWRWMRRQAYVPVSSVSGVVPWGDAVDVETGRFIERFQQWRIRDYEDPPRVVEITAGILDGSGRVYQVFAPVDEDDPENQQTVLVADYRFLGDGFGTESYLAPIEWGDYKAIYQAGSQHKGFPHLVAVSPDNSLAFGPKPSDGSAYRARTDYYEAPQDLVNETDVPNMPDQFHMLIVYDAMLNYGYSRVATEVLEASTVFSTPMLNQLRASQADPVRLGGPLI